MFSVLERLAPLAINLMGGAYAHGGHVHPRHYMDGGYGEEYPTPPQYQDPQAYMHPPQQPYPQNEPNMNAPTGEPVDASMQQYAHGGMHPHHYNYGGIHHMPMHHMGGHHYNQGGHLPHYGWGGAFKGMMNAAKPMIHQGINKGVEHFGNKAAHAATKFATKHLGEEAGQAAGTLARHGVQHMGQRAHEHMKGVGGPLYPYQR